MANMKKNFGGNSYVCAASGPDGFVPRLVNGIQSYPRLPAMKRPASAPVSMQGWLQKQGSDGLMLWKKRWFVLSEYCLYYYKNSNEDKVLGSILLPSYKISPCSVIEGKLFRKKFSFKAEHANMRTYYFAADCRERMVQWMNAMSLATIAQEQSLGLIENNKKEDFICSEKLLNVNFHAPGNSTSRLIGTTTAKENYHENGGCGGSSINSSVQPLYVNAPPKPRRTADSWDSSYDRSSSSSARATDRSQEYVVSSSGRHFPCRLSSDVEVRYTPEGYGTPTPQSQLRPRVSVVESGFSSPEKAACAALSDYEELYSLTAACQNAVKTVADRSLRRNEGEVGMGMPSPSSSWNLQLANRPRSVDFLQSRGDKSLNVANDSSARRKVVDCDGDVLEFSSSGVQVLPRPKSSIDVVSDSYHWSEQRYAESMRKSAQYLVPKTNQPHLTRNIVSNKAPFGGDSSCSNNGSSVSNKNLVAATKSCSARLAKSSFSAVVDDSSFSSNRCGNERMTKFGQNDFTRSKSARMARDKAANKKEVDDLECGRPDRTAHPKESNDHYNQHQFQQREESMKRLLEWKQRMLQSPLSRKSLMSSSSGDESKKGTAAPKIVSDDIHCRGLTHLPTPKNVNLSSHSCQHIRSGPCNGQIMADSKMQYCQPSTVQQMDSQSGNCSIDGRSEEMAANVVCRPTREKVNVNGNEENALPSCVPFYEMRQPPPVSENSRIFDGRIAPSFESENNVASEFMEVAHQEPTTLSETSSFVSNRTAIPSNEFCQDKRATAAVDCKYEMPPQNIVQDRIKVFEKPHVERTLDGKSTAPKVSSPKSSAGRTETSPPQQPATDRSEEKRSISVVSANQPLPRINEENGGELVERPPPPPFKSTRDFLLNVDWTAETYCGSGGGAGGGGEAVISESDEKSQRSETKLSSSRCSSITEEGKVPAQEAVATATAAVATAARHVDEDHYLPMAPCKKPLFNTAGDLFYHTRSNSASSASQIMILETLLSEDIENSYVEMTVGGEKKPYPVPTNANVDDGKCDSQKSSHYELLYKASSSVAAAAATATATEPLYMEVVTTEQKSAVDDDDDDDDNADKCAVAESSLAGVVLPDILNSPNTLLRQLTDSSDADDEASKDFDPLLDVPQHPRFSLSDTFRPASYYLGTGVSDRSALGLSFDQPDSSDSDLVSPPPIPTSPPPLDDFDRSPGTPEIRNEANVGNDSEDGSVESRSLSLPAYKSQRERDNDGNGSEFSECNDDEGDGNEAPQPLDQVIDYVKWSTAISHSSSNRVDKASAAAAASDVRTAVDEASVSSSDIPSESFSICGGVAGTAADCTAGAPYYYADLLKSDECGGGGGGDKWATLESSKKAEEKFVLNNRRVNVSGAVETANSSKRNDVGKKVNQIVDSGERQQQQQQLSLLSQSQQQLLLALDKCEKNSTTTTMRRSVSTFCKRLDDKNIYNAELFQNKLCKVGGGERCCESLDDALNLFVSAGGDGGGSAEAKAPSVSQSDAAFLDRRKPFGGLLGDDHRERSRSSAQCLTSEDLWLEDNRWRETLRKTSLRHARSLDDLDRENESSATMNTSSTMTAKSGRQSADILSSSDSRKSSFGKLSREVTYVNDCVSAQMRKAKQNSKEYTEDYREIRKIKRYSRPSVGNHSHVRDGGGGSEDDDEAHYERLDPRATLAQNGGVAYYHHQHQHQLHHHQLHERANRENAFAVDAVKQPPTQQQQHGKNNTQPKSGAQSFLEEGVYPTKPPSFEIDREKLRQWDLMSSAPVATFNAIQRYPVAEMRAYQMERNAIRIASATERTPPSSPALDSDFAIGRNQPSLQSRVPPMLDRISPIIKGEYGGMASSDEELRFQNEADDESPVIHRRVTPDNVVLNSASMNESKTDNTWDLNVSAGELLGRTHEELVLLLIQLRRQSASLCKAMENCHYEIESQARLSETRKLRKLTRPDRVEELKKRLTELEKQYEKGKPLVNLVDNMVKLGSLYRNAPPDRLNQFKEHPLKSKIEFNDRIQEHRLVAEERKEWDRVHSDHNGLQVKVEELYKLDRELQRESNQLQNLKQDKDLLEYALRGLKCKMQGIHDNPSEMERYKRQQLILEQELTHVRSVLCSNSKKLEETIAANAKLEAELVILRQKLQLASHRPSQENVMTAPTIAALEGELRKVQMLVGNLQRQRAELNSQVRQLTEKSKNLCRQVRPTECDSNGLADADTTGSTAAAKRRIANGWIETDLDNGVTLDANDEKIFALTSTFNSHSFVSLYCRPEKERTAGYCDSSISCQAESTTLCGSNFSELFCSPACKERPYCEQMDINESDDKTKRFYGIVPREKSQEIKTVRIVKRESERRQRDRDRNNVGIPVALNSKRNNACPENCVPVNTHLNEVTEEKDSFLVGCGVTIANTDLSTGFGHRDRQIPYSLASSSSMGTLNESANFGISKEDEKDEHPYRSESSENGSAVENDVDVENDERDDNVELFVDKLNKNQNEATGLSSIYRSKAAKEIVEELLISKVRVDRKNGGNRRTSKEKRRHHTISNNKPILPLDIAKENARARDDVDMERALRPRLNGTPDVVRSTLCRSDACSYDARTIDNVIGMPEKIFIPERYVPENTPQLSPEERDKRLRKAEAIRKMLSETGAFSSPQNDDKETNEISHFNKNNIEEKKRQRDHILQLNQLLARQVMEKSKLVAEIGTMVGS